jgi:hypothetical protein
MIRALIVGVTVLALSVAAVGCDDDDEEPGGGATPGGTPTVVADPTEPADRETPEPGDPTAEPTESLGLELPQDVIDAVEAYIVDGNIPAFPETHEITPADACTTAGQVCYDPDESDFDETTATVRVYPYASDEIQNVLLENVDGEWEVTSSGSATE